MPTPRRTLTYLLMTIAVTWMSGGIARANHAVDCVQGFRTSGGAWYDGYFVNESSSVVFADCSLSRNQCSGNKIKVYYQDNQSGGNLRCYAYGSTVAPPNYYTPSRFSCGSTGGCATNSDPGFASNQMRTLDITVNSSCYAGVVCEVPQGIWIYAVDRATTP